MAQAPVTAVQAETGRRPRLGRYFWRMSWANAISSTGDGALVAALPLLAVTITKDPRLVAVVTAATYLPWMGLSLPAGVLVDRYDRATLMWRAQAVQAAVVAVLAMLIVFHRAGIDVLALGGLLLGCAEVIFSNAAQSALPALVPPELLPKANGHLQIGLTVGESFAGPPVGSLLFAAAAALPFGLDAASFAGSAALVATLPRSPTNRQHTDRPKMRTQVAQGLRWLAGHRLLRVIAVLLGVYNFANQMGQAVLVLLATQTLHVGTRGYGFLLAAAAVGSVLGGLVNPLLTRRLGMLPSLIIGGGINAAVFVGIGLAPSPAVAAVMLAGQGFAVAMWNVVTISLRQRIVPSALLGRVNSVYRMLGWGLMPIGALAGGFVAHAAGLRAPYVVAGVLCGVSLLAALPLLLAAGRDHAAELPAPPARSARSFIDRGSAAGLGHDARSSGWRRRSGSGSPPILPWSSVTFQARIPIRPSSCRAASASTSPQALSPVTSARSGARPSPLSRASAQNLGLRRFPTDSRPNPPWNSPGGLPSSSKCPPSGPSPGAGRRPRRS
jgi:MFS family permease